MSKPTLALLVAPACLLFSTLVAATVNPAVGPKQAHPQIDVSRMGTHEKQVAAVTRIVAKLFERTLYPVRGDAPQVLQFEVPDSRYRYLIFCFSTVHTVCARRMKNPDAVLNECQYKLLGGAITYEGTDGFFFKEPIRDPQKVANEGSEYLDDFNHRWSAYVDIVKGGNRQPATSLVVSMLHTTESDAPARSGDAPRLWPLACWVEGRFDEIWKAFIELGG